MYGRRQRPSKKGRAVGETREGRNLNRNLGGFNLQQTGRTPSPLNSLGTVPSAETPESDEERHFASQQGQVDRGHEARCLG